MGNASSVMLVTLPKNTFWLGGFLFLVFLGALLWAKGRDPFVRVEFRLRTESGRKVNGIVVLPKPVRPRPVVVYVYGSGGSVLNSGTDLRQTAELGLAVAAFDYNQTNQNAFNEEFRAVLRHLQKQKWALSNATAWVGFSLGAQRTLNFALTHPEIQPQLLVRLAGGCVEELESQPKVQRSKSKSGLLNRDTDLHASTPNPRLSTKLNCPVLLVHGEHDTVFPMADAQRVAAVLRANGVPVELKILPGQPHGFEADRQALLRAVGEYCLTRLTAPNALSHYRSIALWQAQAWSLWAYWLPAFVWAVAVLGWKWRVAWAARAKPRAKLTRLEIGLRWLAGALAVLAFGQTAVHWVTPRLAVSGATLRIARQWLVPTLWRPDFDALAALPVWRGQRLEALLEHAELASYNRTLVNWQLDDHMYREFVLSPLIAAWLAEELRWRRPLWESFYPRIRKEQTPEAAARIVVRHLRERLTIVVDAGATADVGGMWARQIADETGFEVIYVAALRSTGIAARLDQRTRAEFWTGSTWQPAPRPLLVSWIE